MGSSFQIRLTGIFLAFLLGLLVPGFLLGPVLFEGLSIDSITNLALITAICSGLLGVWLFVISCLAFPKDIEKILNLFQGSEAVIFFIPYMLMIGSKSVWYRLSKPSGFKRD